MRKTFFRWLFVALLIAAAVAISFNRQWIYDLARGIAYKPSAEMVTIRDSLDLTDRGKFLFNAAWPKLSERDEFNNKCRVNGEEVAILGCYTEGNIYVFDITDEKLEGIRELTTAHELLHVNFARMSDVEKAELKTALDNVYNENKGILEKDLDVYEEVERFEELYVRAGTEIKTLPKNLEEHYAKLFKDQDGIVAYYERYISVFWAIEAELDTLMTEMTNISAEIDAKTAEYENGVADLNKEITSFNGCAQTPGCFANQWDFDVKRNALIAEQDALSVLYDEINNLVDEYNARVEKYNNDVIESEKLNSIINSNTKPQEIE